MLGIPLNIAEIDERIAALRENLRELVEQAAAYSGASDEDLASRRIAEQEAELELLTRQRVQPIEGPTHVHRPTVELHAHLSFGEEHQRLTRCKVNPPPRSSLSSTAVPRANFPLRAPRSTNAGSPPTARPSPPSCRSIRPRQR